MCMPPISSKSPELQVHQSIWKKVKPTWLFIIMKKTVLNQITIFFMFNR